MRFSIKRRLVISNILMVIIPTFLTVVLFVGLVFTLFGGVLSEDMLASIPDRSLGQLPADTIDFTGLTFPTSDDVLVYQLATGNYVLILPAAMNARLDAVDWESATQPIVDVVDVVVHGHDLLRVGGEVCLLLGHDGQD
jgi:hypothetical protein